MNIVAGTEKQTILNSFLNEYNFGKIQQMFNLNETGILAETQKKEFSSNMKFSFKTWKFTGTEVESKSGNVLITGNGFEGRPLLGIMQASSKTEKARAVFAYNLCVSQAVKEKFELPTNGAGGILYGETENKIRLLFLPQDIFEFAAHNTSEKDYQTLQAIWQDKNFLSQNKDDANNARALFFTRGVFIYTALCGEFPFPKENMEERQADILDSNYLPLKNKVNGVSELLSDLVSFDLERSSTAANKEQIKNDSDDSVRNFCHEELAKELGLNEDGSIKDAERKTKLSDEEFKKAARKILSKKKAHISASRTFRKNSALFIFAIIMFFTGLIIRCNVKNTNLSKPTTVSLSARETIEVFFTGMHNIDSQMMQYSCEGEAPKRLLDSVNNIHVASKLRYAYSLGNETLTPEMWVYKAEKEDCYQFGLTHFKLGKTLASLSDADIKKNAPRRRDNPVPLNETDGAKETYFVSFFRIHSEGMQSQITAENFSGTVEATFLKDRWLVTDVNIESEEKLYSIEEFSKDRKAAIEQQSGDSILAAQMLREKYAWIPTDKALYNARIEDETIAAKRARGEVY